MLDINKIWPVFVEIAEDYYGKVNEEELKNNPEIINGGYCDFFSEAIFSIYGGEIVGSDSDDIVIDFQKRFNMYPWDHSFIKLNNKYYDAECLEGTEDFADLPFYKRQLKDSSLMENKYIKNIHHTAKLLKEADIFFPRNNDIPEDERFIFTPEELNEIGYELYAEDYDTVRLLIDKVFESLFEKQKAKGKEFTAVDLRNLFKRYIQSIEEELEEHISTYFDPENY